MHLERRSLLRFGPAVATTQLPGFCSDQAAQVLPWTFLWLHERELVVLNTKVPGLQRVTSECFLEKNSLDRKEIQRGRLCFPYSLLVSNTETILSETTWV